MSKQDLVNFMTEETGLTKADATRALDAFMKGVTEGLKKEGKVTLTGFATFEVKATSNFTHTMHTLLKVEKAKCELNASHC